MLGAILPHINGTSLSWSNDARYCVTSGILWGEAHWSQMPFGVWSTIEFRSRFEPVLHLDASRARRIFSDFIPSVNHTAHHEKPLYQLWRVESSTETLVKDITCGDGVSASTRFLKTKRSSDSDWILDFASRELHAAPLFEPFAFYVERKP